MLLLLAIYSQAVVDLEGGGYVTPYNPGPRYISYKRYNYRVHLDFMMHHYNILAPPLHGVFGCDV